MLFIQNDSYERCLIKKFQQLPAMANPFDVDLCGFGSFDHTLFVDIKSGTPVLQLVTTHRHTLRPLVNGSNGHSVRFTGKPHITIARKLTPSQHASIWPIWRRTQYSSTFRARNMTLLKRQVGTYQYSTVHKFDFLGLPPAFTQGKLFA